jgi:hypothetical protein
MSPRIIHIPLSGGDRKAQAKGIRYSHGIHASHYRESVPIRSAAEAKIREADRLECEAWNAIMWTGGRAMPSPGDPQAEPTIAKAINGGFELLEAKCNRATVSRWCRFAGACPPSERPGLNRISRFRDPPRCARAGPDPDERPRRIVPSENPAPAPTGRIKSASCAGADTPHSSASENLE